MKFQSIQEAIAQKAGKVAIRGWVYRERGSNQLKFVVLRDSSNVIQCVFEREKFEKQWEEIDKIQVEASMEIEGTIKEDKRAPTGYEVNVEKFRVVGMADTFPITKDQSPEFLLDVRHLALRSRKLTAVMKIRHNLFKAFREYFDEQGFYEFHSPIFQATQCEGGSSLFSVKYFNDVTYLAQTWQLYAEAGIFSLEKIYTISPSFRAEKSKTPRHLTEYWHAEMEQAWADFEEIKNHGEAVIKHIVKRILEKNQEELKILERDTGKLQKVLEKPFPRISYDEALELLKEKCNVEIPWGKDLRTIEEDKLGELFDTPFVVSYYPKIIKAFYMKEKEDNPKVVKGCDFIAPEGYGELIGGSERETDIEKLKENLKAQGEDPKNYEYYFDTRRYGSVPHGGFGMGMERIINWVCDLKNIKDAIPFPRTVLRWKP